MKKGEKRHNIWKGKVKIMKKSIIREVQSVERDNNSA